MAWLLASSFVVALWGASTAVIFYLDSLPPKTFRLSMAAATLVLLISAIVIWMLRNDESLAAIYCSFAAGLLAWGWTELALYLGFVTGPRKQRCATECKGPAHFGHAVAANLWHELAVIFFACLILLSGNVIASQCFIMLWLMHLSARLNVFLGARNVSAEFVPDHMDVLKGFMRQRNMNALFPISCLAIILLVAFLMSMPQTPGVVMAETLAAIGLLEHVLLMLPLPVDKLWRWSLAGPSSRGGDQPRANPNHPHSKTDLRFLGS